MEPVEMVDQMVREKAERQVREELPVRVQRVKAVVQRFRPQIDAVAGDYADDLLHRQEVDLMRAGLYTEPSFRRTAG